MTAAARSPHRRLDAADGPAWRRSPIWPRQDTADSGDPLAASMMPRRRHGPAWRAASPGGRGRRGGRHRERGAAGSAAVHGEEVAQRPTEDTSGSGRQLPAGRRRRPRAGTFTGGITVPEASGQRVPSAAKPDTGGRSGGRAHRGRDRAGRHRRASSAAP